MNKDNMMRTRLSLLRRTTCEGFREETESGDRVTAMFTHDGLPNQAYTLFDDCECEYSETAI